MVSEVGSERDIEQGTAIRGNLGPLVGVARDRNPPRVPGRTQFRLWLGLLVPVVVATDLYQVQYNGGPGSVVMATEAAAPLQSQLDNGNSKGDTAKATKKPGPIADIFDGLLSFQRVYYASICARGVPGPSTILPTHSQQDGGRGRNASPSCGVTGVTQLARLQGRRLFRGKYGNMEVPPICSRPVYRDPGQATGFTGPIVLLGCSSVVEQPLDKRQVLGSNPRAPTILS